MFSWWEWDSLKSYWREWIGPTGLEIVHAELSISSNAGHGHPVSPTAGVHRGQLVVMPVQHSQQNLFVSHFKSFCLPFSWKDASRSRISPQERCDPLSSCSSWLTPVRPSSLTLSSERFIQLILLWNTSGEGNPYLATFLTSSFSALFCPVWHGHSREQAKPWLCCPWGVPTLCDWWFCSNFLS